MLTGVGWSAGSLTLNQIARVECLVAIDAGRHSGDVGKWMTLAIQRRCSAGRRRWTT